MRKLAIFSAILAVAAAVAAYFASPYWAIKQFKDAVLQADADKIDMFVDFPAVRESLRNQFTSQLTKSLDNDPSMKSNPFAGLGAMMIPAMVDKMIGTVVTADGIAALARGKKAENTNSESHDPADISFDGEYLSLDRFRVRDMRGEDGKPNASFLFERRGLFSWKLIRVEVPEDIFEKRNPETSALDTSAPTAEVPTETKIEQDNVCVGYWSYIPEDITKEVGFSVHIPQRGNARIQYADFGSWEGEVSFPNVGGAVEVQGTGTDASESIHLDCETTVPNRSPNVVINSDSMTPKEFPVVQTEGDIFWVAKQRGWNIEDGE